LYPIKNYAYVEFMEVVQAETLMSRVVQSTEYPHIKYVPLVYANKERPTMFFYSRVAPEDVGKSLIAAIPNASYEVVIPGIRLIRDFLTEEEESTIMAQVEVGEWNRMS
jgi:hypothetical protein